MVIAAVERRASAPALIVPDEQSWVVWGVDPVGEGFESARDLGRVRRVLLPGAVPRALARPLADCLDQLSDGVQMEHRPIPGLIGTPPGAVATHALRADEDGAPDEAVRLPEEHMEHHGEGDAAHEHGHGEDHEDMMAISGEPSADGLVMEPIEYSLGPLGSPLPGGLVADVVLDGDVVAECTVRALLRHPELQRGDLPSALPDPMAPRTWFAAIAAATEADARAPAARLLRLAGVELDRATSHLAWFRVLARLLGWVELVERITAALAPLLRAQTSLGPPAGAVGQLDAAIEEAAGPLEPALARARQLQELCADSRRLAIRAAGRGALDGAAASRAGVMGPLARASGLCEDVRSEDPLYRELGFAPVVGGGGDALARTLLRVEEACAAIELARMALARAHTGGDAAVPVASAAGDTVEGPRGPIRARRVGDELRFEAPGQQAALEAAGAAAVGLEWASALVVLLSFDLSPWMVGL